MGATSKGREGREDGTRREGQGRERYEVREGRVGDGKEEKGKGGEENFRAFAQLQICQYTTAVERRALLAMIAQSVSSHTIDAAAAAADCNDD